VTRLLLLTATDIEAALLRERAQGWAGVSLVVSGVGAVNAAHAVTLAIASARPEAIIVCGIGGAYPGSGLQIGDVVCAEAEIYGDLGASSPAGFLDMRALGFALTRTEPALYNELPLQVFPVERRARFVTVNTCTGTDAAARELAARTRGAVENMEGAAVAHVAHLHGIAVGEVRGISNLVTDRDPSAWRVKEAARAAQEALAAWLSRR
jgi:futalosine hydrolase